MIGRILLFVLAIAAAGLATPGIAGNITLQNKVQLEALLKESSPCCVIDARDEKRRKQNPISSALAYKAGMKINPTSAVVVVADTDERALAVGEALAKSSTRKRSTPSRAALPRGKR